MAAKKAHNRSDAEGADPLGDLNCPPEDYQLAGSLHDRSLDPSLLDPSGIHHPELYDQQFEEFTRLVQTHWSVGISYADLFGGTRLLIFGDTNHSFVGLRKSITQELDGMAEAGVTHLALEIDSKLDPEVYGKSYAGTFLPHRLRIMHREANARSIDIIYMGLGEGERQGSWSRSDFLREHGKHMGAVLGEFMHENPGAMVVGLMGSSHISNAAEVPAVLTEQRVAFRSFAVVTEGQRIPQQGRLQVSFCAVPAAEAVAQTIAQSADRRGYVEVPERMAPFNGFIHLTRPTMDALIARKVPDKSPALLEDFEQHPKSSGLIQVAWSSIRLPASAVRESVALTYQSTPERIYPEEHQWEESNREKLLELVTELEGFNNGQKLYLVGLLSSWAIDSGNLSFEGSIVDIGYVADSIDPYFEVRTLDLRHGTLEPGTDYSAQSLDYEITLQELEELYGLGEVEQRHIDALKDIRIRPVSQRPEAVINFSQFLIGNLAYPAKTTVGIVIGDGAQLRSFQNHILGRTTAKLGVRDFELSPVEEGLQDIVDSLLRISQPEGLMYQLAYRQNGFFHMEESKPQFDSVRQMVASPEDLLSVRHEFRQRLTHMSYVSDSPSTETEFAILDARKQFTFLSKGDAQKCLGAITDFIEELEQTLDVAEKLVEGSPELGKRRSPEYEKDCSALIAGVRGEYGQLKERVAQVELLMENNANFEPDDNQQGLT